MNQLRLRWVAFLGITFLLVACGGSASSNTTPPETGDVSTRRLAVVQARGRLVCGVNDERPGFGVVDAEGSFVGFDVDFCRAVAAGVLGDATLVDFVPLSAQARFDAVRNGEVDVLIRNTTWTFERDGTGLDFGPTIFYDGQGVIVPRDSGIEAMNDLGGGRICVLSNTTTELNLNDYFGSRGFAVEVLTFEDNESLIAAYEARECNGYSADRASLTSSRVTDLSNPNDHIILSDTISKEPLGPVVADGDSQWLDAVSWIVFATIQAEEFGVTSENVDALQDSPDSRMRLLLGRQGDLGANIGLMNDFAYHVISQVGNYAEIYDRNLGPDTAYDVPRGLNRLWVDGGLLYSPPFR